MTPKRYGPEEWEGEGELYRFPNGAEIVVSGKSESERHFGSGVGAQRAAPSEPPPEKTHRWWPWGGDLEKGVTQWHCERCGAITESVYEANGFVNPDCPAAPGQDEESAP